MAHCARFKLSEGPVTEIYTGGCACGAVRYEGAAVPKLSLHCQCRDCQRITGTGHASMMVFRAAKVSLTGHLSYHMTKSNSGDTASRGFCPSCGSFVMAKSSGYPDAVWLTAGSLDEPERFKPKYIVYAASGRSWDHMDPALTYFPKMPPSK